MPTYYYGDRYGSKDAYELARRAGKEFRHSHRSTNYIVNEGKMIIDKRTLRDLREHDHQSNTIIYNAPGSTLWVEHRRDHDHDHDHDHHHSYYRSHSGGSRYRCRSCYRYNSRYYDGYCADCSVIRYESPRRREVITVSDRQTLEYPERKVIAWR